MLSVYFNRLCSAWCSKGTTQTRGQEQSGQWLVGTYQAFSPRSTHLHLGQRRQHNSAIQRRDSSFTWSKMWMHTAAQCGVVNWCERSFVRQSPIFLCNLAISPSCAVCGARQCSGVDMARVYYLLNKVEWIAKRKRMLERQGWKRQGNKNKQHLVEKPCLSTKLDLSLMSGCQETLMG